MPQHRPAGHCPVLKAHCQESRSKSSTWATGEERLPRR